MVEKMDKVWKKFLRNHWQMIVLFIIVAIIALIGAIYVFFWFVGEAQLTGLIPALLGEWAMSHFIFFLLYLIFWELVLIGIPVLIVIAAAYFLWWKKIPDAERREYRRAHVFFGNRNKRTDAGGGFSFIIFIAFVIKIILDGNWNRPFAEWSIDYLVYSCLIAFIWVAIVIGIPMLIGATWWIRHEMKK